MKPKMAHLVAAAIYYVSSNVAFFYAGWQAYHGRYDVGAFFMATAIAFDRYGDFYTKRARETR